MISFNFLLSLLFFSMLVMSIHGFILDAPPTALLEPSVLQSRYPKDRPLRLSMIGGAIPSNFNLSSLPPSPSAFFQYMMASRGVELVNSSFTPQKLLHARPPQDIDFLWTFGHQYANDFMKNPQWYQFPAGTVISSIPGLCWEVASKASFAEHYNRFLRRFPDTWGAWHPESYNMKNLDDRAAFLSRESQLGPDALWIVKPVRNSEARGIRMLHDVPRGVLHPRGSEEWNEEVKLIKSAPVDEKPVNEMDIVQRYIVNPLLFEGKKFTIRQELLVTSVDPLRVYAHWNGKVKISTMVWDPSSTVKGVHVTNTAYQKHLEAFDQQAEGYLDATASDEVGPMRSLRWFFEQHLDAEKAVKVAREMDKVLAQSVLMIKEKVQKVIDDGKFSYVSFKTLGILGSDIEFLSDWQPIVLEDNCSPRLTGHRDLEWENQFFQEVWDAMMDLKGVVSHHFPAQLNDIKKELQARPEWAGLAANETFSLAQAEYELPIAQKYGFRRIFPPIYQPELLDTFESFLSPMTPLDQLSFQHTRAVLNNRPGLEPFYPTPKFKSSSHVPDLDQNPIH